jgi:hypothetical protein
VTTEVLNDSPRPRVVVDINDAELLRQMQVILGWPGTFAVTQVLGDIDWTEWDAVITDAPPLQGDMWGVAAHSRRRFPDGLCVFYIHQDIRQGLVAIERSIKNAAEEAGQISRDAVAGISLSLDPQGLDSDTVALVRDSLYPAVLARAQHWGVRASDGSSPLTMTPLLSGPGGLIIAATYDRGDAITNWILPADTDLVPWVQLAFARWQKELPSRFPSLPSWEHAEAWRTGEERKLLDALNEADQVLNFAVQEHARQTEAARATLLLLEEQIDAGQRRLLTGTGEDLEAAVATSLKQLGFSVRSMDHHYPEGSRREDLQIEDAGWFAVVEITGVRRGVQQAKWQRLMTHLTMYLRLPDAKRTAVPWLVVNQELERSPETRAGLWQEEFRGLVAEAGGLAIESPALFELIEMVEADVVSSLEVRSVLQGATGVFTLEDARLLSPGWRSSNPGH